MENDWDDDSDDLIACPECGAETYADSESCYACGYWLTDDDRTADWRAGSSSERIKTIGLCLIGLAAGATLAVWLL